MAAAPTGPAHGEPAPHWGIEGRVRRCNSLKFQSGALAFRMHPPAALMDRMMGLAPNLDDYDRVRATFTWAAARAELEGLPDEHGLNIAHEAVDRHAAGIRLGVPA